MDVKPEQGDSLLAHSSSFMDDPPAADVHGADKISTGRPAGREVLEYPQLLEVSDQSFGRVPAKVLEDGEDEGDERVLTELYTRVKSARVHIENYTNLFWFFLFTVIYIVVLYLQADSHTTFLVAQSHVPLLPPDYAANDKYVFDSSDDIYDWLNNSIIQTVWADAACGNGICDRPQEYAAFGPDNRFGCASDCGLFPNVTSVTVYVQAAFQTQDDQAASYWNLCLTSPVELCWYENDQTFTGDLSSSSVTELALPDGNWTVRFSAPNGGLTMYLIQGNTKPVAAVGLGCLPFFPQQQKSDYSVCRVACTSYIQDCLAATCTNMTKAMVVQQFQNCLEVCYGDTALDHANTLQSYSCQQILPSAKYCPPSREATPLLPAAPKQPFQIPTSTPRITQRAALWETLGATDDTRLFNLAAAIQRATCTWIKEECLVAKPKAVTLAPRLTAFFCTFFGGPTNLTGCAYKQNITKAVLTTDTELFTEMGRMHQRLNLSQAEQDNFVEIMLLALRSVTPLAETTVTAFTERLRLLDQVLVQRQENGCHQASTHVPMSTGSSNNFLSRQVEFGQSVQWIWTDDAEHSVAYFDGLGAGVYTYLFGIGSETSVVSRNTICTPDNVGRGGLDATASRDKQAA